MKKLTEEMVIARTKISDMTKVKRLNCWGSELADISLLRRMPNVEVLSLSINKISYLNDLEHCQHLQELYVRQNEIRDINQICYLQNLPNLKHLWLGENPCASTDGYRLAVIRTLPQLQKLDNIAIQQDELQEAMKKGRILVHPDEQQDNDDVYEQQQQQPLPVYNRSSQQQDYVEQYYQNPDRSPPRQEIEYEPEDAADYYEEEDRREYESPSRQSPPRRQSDQRRSFSPEQETTGPVYYEDRRNANNYEQESPRHQPQQYYDRSPTKEYVEETRITSESPRFPISQSNQSIKDYATNGDQRQYPIQYSRQDGGSDGSNHSNTGAYEQQSRKTERCEKNISCPAIHRPPFNRRPVTRNSNILSAVLCLVKELDYPSLEVVDMAVRCRMDELEE